MTENMDSILNILSELWELPGSHHDDVHLRSRFEEAESKLRNLQQTERERIAEFLMAVYEYSTHGASNLFERAIQAVKSNDMADPVRIADPAYATGDDGKPARVHW